jgi:rhodanese-related sulfurtransferase
MSDSIGIERLKELIDAGAQLVEVLPVQEFEEEHLPGAINLPLKQLNRETAAVLDCGRSVVVYCWDGL